MPKYRAHVEFTDDLGREHTEVVDVESESDNAEDLARAAVAKVPGFDQSGEERLPHNIRWERIG